MEQAKIGDKVKAYGMVIMIASIISQDWWDPEGWYIEFVDTDDHYHYWKQQFDGGELIRC